MTTTNKFDGNGQEIFVNDKVLCAWGVFRYKGQSKNIYEIHTITTKPAHLMNDGNMHDDGGGVIFCLGNTYNFWRGKDVKKLTTKEVEDIGMPENTRFFFDKNHKAVIFDYFTHSF